MMFMMTMMMMIVEPKDLGTPAYRYQAQGPRWGVRNARGQMKRAQTSRLYCWGQPYPRQAKIMGEKNTTSPEAVHSRIAKEIPGPMG